MDNNNKNSTEKTVSYRNKHILTIFGVAYLVIGQIISLVGIWKLLMLLGYSFLVGMLMGTFEKKDELTKQTLAKANEITLYVLLVVVFIIAIITQNITSMELASDLCFYSMLGAIALRSAVFLWLDRTPKDENDDESEEE